MVATNLIIFLRIKLPNCSFEGKMWNFVDLANLGVVRPVRPPLAMGLPSVCLSVCRSVCLLPKMA